MQPRSRAPNTIVWVIGVAVPLLLAIPGSFRTSDRRSDRSRGAAVDLKTFGELRRILVGGGGPTDYQFFLANEVASCTIVMGKISRSKLLASFVSTPLS
jgi:hypothetical protein